MIQASEQIPQQACGEDWLSQCTWRTAMELISTLGLGENAMPEQVKMLWRNLWFVDSPPQHHVLVRSSAHEEETTQEWVFWWKSIKGFWKAFLAFAGYHFEIMQLRICYFKKIQLPSENISEFGFLPKQSEKNNRFSWWTSLSCSVIAKLRFLSIYIFLTMINIVYSLLILHTIF